MPPLGASIDEVYRATFARMRARNELFHARYPGDRARLLVADVGQALSFAEDASFMPQNTTPALSTDVRNNLYLLDRMRDALNRTARYHCVLALARNGTVLLRAEGSVEGEILSAPRGNGGFGYDPLFWLPELGRTMAEITLEDKHQLSHRGRAFRALLPQLKTLLP